MSFFQNSVFFLNGRYYKISSFFSKWPLFSKWPIFSKWTLFQKITFFHSLENARSAWATNFSKNRQNIAMRKIGENADTHWFQRGQWKVDRSDFTFSFDVMVEFGSIEGIVDWSTLISDRGLLHDDHHHWKSFLNYCDRVEFKINFQKVKIQKPYFLDLIAQ